MKSTGKNLMIYGLGVITGIVVVKYGKQAKECTANVMEKLKEKARAKAKNADVDENPEA